MKNIRIFYLKMSMFDGEFFNIFEYKRVFVMLILLLNQREICYIFLLLYQEKNKSVAYLSSNQEEIQM